MDADRLFRKAELVAFAKDLNSRLPSPTRPFFTRPSVKPKQYHTNVRTRPIGRNVFRFLDLPPELRNWAYRELLTLTNSPRLYPEILQTSKVINSEASGILYEENRIYIRINHDGIYARGMPCGSYRPDVPPTQTKQHSIGTFEWPDFLRRTRYINVDCGGLQHARSFLPEIPRLGALHYILYSLCTFLQTSDKLHSLEIDLGWLFVCFQFWNAVPHLYNGIAAALCPICLLPSATNAYVVGLPEYFQHAYMPPAGIHQLAERLVAGNKWTGMMQLQAAISTYALFGLPIRLKEAFILAGQLFGTCVALRRLALVPSGRGMRKVFAWYLRLLRMDWDATKPVHLNDMMLKRVYGLVQLDVAVRLLLRKRGLDEELEYIDDAI